MGDTVKELRDTYTRWNNPPSPELPEGAGVCLRAADEIEAYREIMDNHRRLVRELDVALNGEDGAAQQASLCDIVGQVKDRRWKLVRADEV